MFIKNFFLVLNKYFIEIFFASWFVIFSFLSLIISLFFLVKSVFFVNVKKTLFFLGEFLVTKFFFEQFVECNGSPLQNIVYLARVFQWRFCTFTRML